MARWTNAVEAHVVKYATGVGAGATIISQVMKLADGTIVVFLGAMIVLQYTALSAQIGICESLGFDGIGTGQYVWIPPPLSAPYLYC
jgi:hypothetical protein